jgi:hypothetical protein
LRKREQTDGEEEEGFHGVVGRLVGVIMESALGTPERSFGNIHL